MFAESVKNLLEWMNTHDGDSELAKLLQLYLSTRGEGSMTSLTKGKKHLASWAQEHDTLGWDNFLEGRICASFFDLQQRFLGRIQSKRKIKTWAINFIHQVLSITHQQWLYRNTRINIRQVEGKTNAEHLEIMQAVHERLKCDITELLPQHHHLLERDFTSLGEGSTIDRQYWIAQMDSALAAAKVSQPGHLV
jgi:hypothetical protein